jgi:3-oxoacyl-[acyl-carrier protein] reductase
MIETGLHARPVIVTGAATGIGHATALAFARQGARVAGWDVAESPGFSDEMTSAGGAGLFQKVNVADPAAVAAAVSQVVAAFGGIAVLVNNAGIMRDGQLIKFKEGQLLGSMSDEQFDAVIDVNLRGVFLCTRAVVPTMIAGGGGVILNASSVVGLYGNFGQTNYVASKAGVIGMTRVWARELGRYGIRVNAVAPGLIATGMLNQMPEKILDTMKQRTPLGRLGRPEDIANAYVWLASNAASFITGTVLSVDGGIVTGT